MSDKKLEAAVEKELQKMLKENPSSLMMWMMIQMGKTVIDTNAGSLELKQESTLDGQRYEIKAKITVKKIKK